MCSCNPPEEHRYSHLKHGKQWNGSVAFLALSFLKHSLTTETAWYTIHQREFLKGELPSKIRLHERRKIRMA